MSIQRTSSTSSEETRSPVNPPQQELPQVQIPAASGNPSSEAFAAGAQAVLQTMAPALEAPKSFEHQVDEWMQEDPATRTEAAQRILTCFRNRFSELDLSDLPITSLPECFGNLTALTKLDLSETQLQALPDSIGSLSALRSLNLSLTQLQALPDSISNLSALTYLHLSRTHLQSLPDSIGSLSALRILTLSANQLQSLPELILHLNQQLSIDLTGCNLSPRILENLRAATLAPGYHGPQLHYSMAAQYVPLAEVSLEASLTQVYDRAGIPRDALPILSSVEEPFKGHLAIWLRRLQDTADGGGASTERSKSFYNTMIENLRLAEENPEFRAIFEATIAEASATCGDRVALSVLHLGIQRRLIQVDKTDLHAVAKLLKGIHAMTLLEEIARAKIPTLRFVDEIEVYLGYPIQLRESLHLPLDTESMLFFRCSSLKDQDLQAAEAFVLSFLNNQDAVAEFLISRDEWITALRAKHPREFQSIEDQRNAAAESDSPNYEEIETAYKQSLKALTLEILTSRE